MEGNAQREQIIKDVTAIFNARGIWADANPHPIIDCVIDIEVDGDWKHDHLATRHIMEEHNCHLLGEEEIGNSEDDCYHSMHHYTISN